MLDAKEFEHLVEDVRIFSRHTYSRKGSTLLLRKSEDEIETFPHSRDEFNHRRAPDCPIILAQKKLTREY
jgi:hypothetical protein